MDLKDIELIPCTDLNIELDSEKTTGYDLTVSDNYTFSTDDGVFIQDTMSVFVPLSNEAQKQARDKMVSVMSNTGINATTFELSKEMLVGLYTLTKSEPVTSVKTLNIIDDLKKYAINTTVTMKYKGKLVKSTIGRFILNEALPDYYPFVDKIINKKVMKSILSKILSRNQSDFATTIDALLQLGFYYSTIKPQTITLDMLGNLSPEMRRLKTNLETEKDLGKQSTIINDMNVAMKAHLKAKIPDLDSYVESGASKGSDQLRQVMVSKGTVQDPVGNPFVVKPSIVSGYSPKEYFDASASSRQGLISKALGTAEGGYEFRKIIFAIGNVRADINNPNCFTNNTLDIKLTKDIFKRMTGRYVVHNGRVTPITEKMIGSVIKLRSPIFCKTPKICRICYGDLLAQVSSSNVGLIAASEVGSLAESFMKSVFTTVLTNNNTMYSMCHLWNTKFKDIPTKVQGELETKYLDDFKIKGKDGFVNVKCMQRHPPKDQMLFIKTKSGFPLVCQADHPIIIKELPLDIKYDNITCRLTGDETYSTTGTGVSKELKLTDTRCKTVQAKDLNKYDSIWVDYSDILKSTNNITPELDGYITGVFTGDGNYTYYDKPRQTRVEISSSEGFIHNNIINVLESCELPRYVWSNEDDCRVKIQITEDGFSTKVQSVVLGRYSYEKHLEPNFINYTNEWLLRFMEGLIDTDGSVFNLNYKGNVTSTRARYYTSSYYLLQQIQIICFKLGWRCSSYLADRKGNQYVDPRSKKLVNIKRPQYQIDISFVSDKHLPLSSSKIKHNGDVVLNGKLKGEVPTKGFDVITSIKPINEWPYPVYDLKTESNEFMAGCVQTHNSFHTGGAVRIVAPDIMRDLMANVDDINSVKVDSRIAQNEFDLMAISDNIKIIINRSIFNDKYKINKTPEFIELPVGQFELYLGDLKVVVGLDRPVFVYVTPNVTDTDGIITVLYEKGDKIFKVDSSSLDYSNVVKQLDNLIAGKVPTINVTSIYNAFYNTLHETKGWDSVHLEVLISNVLRAKRDPQKPARLVDPFEYDQFSIKALPGIISYRLGIAFEDFSRALKSGLTSDEVDPSEIEKLLMGIPINEEDAKKHARKQGK